MSERDEDYPPQLIEELTLLVDLVAARAQPWIDAIVAAGHSGDGTTQSTAHGAGAERTDSSYPGGVASGDAAPGGSTGAGQQAPCTWCPLCAVVALVRGQRPELVARVLDQVAELVALLRAVLADRWEPGTVHMPGFRPPSSDPASPGTAGPEAAGSTGQDTAGRGPDEGDEPGPGQGGQPRPGSRENRVQHIAVRRRAAPAGGSA